MRIIVALALPTLLTASAALADPDATRTSDSPAVAAPAAAAPAAAAPADSDTRSAEDIGLLRGQKMPSASMRAASVAAPRPVAVADEPATVRDHAVAPAHMVAATATDGDVTAELAARQMRRYQRAFDGCKAAALKRSHNAAAGSVTLALDIADRKVQNVRVTDDGVHDPAFAACVTGAAQKLSFSLASARLAWPVSIK